MEIILYTCVMIKSTRLEKPHTAPSTTPMDILIRALTKAREIEILEPYQMASKVASPEPPVPKM